MKSIPCYFCHSPCYYQNDYDIPINLDCDQCTKILSNRVVNTLTNSGNELLYFHMYYSFNNKLIHVRLHLQENITHIINEFEYDSLAILPGFTLNPINLKNKLPLYLTFL